MTDVNKFNTDTQRIQVNEPQRYTQEMSTLQKITAISATLANTSIQKTGKCSANGKTLFEYFELSDFLPHLLRELQSAKLGIKIDFTETGATLSVSDAEKKDVEIFTLNFPPNLCTDDNSLKELSPIQRLGAKCTYIRRYLLVQAFNICESDAIDLLTNKEQEGQSEPQNKPQKNTPLSSEELDNHFKMLYNDIIPQIIEALKQGDYKNARQSFNFGFELKRRIETLNGLDALKEEPLKSTLSKFYKLYQQYKKVTAK